MSADAFELTMQEPPRMHERLDYLDDLKGETILAAFDTHDTRHGHVVFVTTNYNWLVLDAESDSCGDDPSINVVTAVSWGKPQTLDYFVAPKRLFDAGCINAEVYRVLQAEEDAKDQASKEARALRLRAELAKLEAERGAA